ncbi:MAG: hypothetical protein KJ904_00090 [Alphaproteobacteria bacterium]|nr:hypothetical protein [Alphaproteobacteria bacterium]MBU0799269.1 hypothetical protein [Alphaproteobacteria bacterium]MBU0885542.1 hypothetical protein [Alphaproteobacteria bacterium]MBU1812981.1 hypothetical protein [Alphaproteobacteria bacterium]MBU2091027.1 hypothetical protein [Alphaproteobacteria bacterium]
MTQPLLYLSDRVLGELRKNVGVNLDRYRTTGFADLAEEPGWDIPLGIEFDGTRLATLDQSTPQNIVSVDLPNSIIVGEAISGLSPAMANEERVWTRLSHVEAIDYCRARWITGREEARHENLIIDHFFAPTQTGIRDDHALSRLWWNYQIARTCMPEDVSGALAIIMKTADIRSNFVERIWMTSRKNIAGAVLRAMKSDLWITANEANFRMFMKSLNRLGGGVVFEVLDTGETDEFVRHCAAYAKAA